MSSAAVIRSQVEAFLAHRIPSALTVHERPQPETLPTGVAEIDAVFGGLPRGSLSEICGPASSGRTTVLHALLASVTGRGEVCALVDAGDSFDPESAAAAGVELSRVLWVRCSPPPAGAAPGEKRPHSKTARPHAGFYARVEQALKAADLLLESGGFGLVVMDLADMPPRVASRIPLTSWFRFRHAVEGTATALVVMEEEAFARTCAAVVLRLARIGESWPAVAEGAPPHARLLSGSRIAVEMARNRVSPAAGKRPARAVAFSARTAWAGAFHSDSQVG
jgi:hypothetical protein